MKLMKMKSVVLVLMLAATVAAAQTNNLTSLLQQGLLEEQANRNLDAAIANYQTLATQFDKDRQLAATAVFRIGECYRMQGKTNEAAAQYQHVLHDFADQNTLVTLSRQNLTGMGLAQGDNGKTVQAASEDSAEMRSLATQMAGISKMKANPTEYAQAVQAIFPDDNLKKMLENLANLQGQEAKLKANPKSSSVTLDNFCIAVNGDENQLSGFRKTMIADNSTNLLATAETELTKQNSWIADRVDFILGIQKARLKVLQSVSDSTVADANQSDNASATTDEEDQEIRRIQQMVQNSPDLINAPGSDKTTPLQRAATAGWIKVATYLFNHGAKVDNVALNNAATVGNRAMVELLLSRGADVNGTFNGLTPLHIAAQNGFQAVMEVLLANKADVNATSDELRKTPLFLAAKNGQSKIVQTLLEHKADANAITQDGWTPLLIAADRNHPEIVKLLLAAGANPNVFGGGTNPNKDQGDGRTPLSLAAKAGSSEIVKMLLAAKADPNGGNYVPPLFAAIQRHDLVSAELLLQAGAKPNALGSADPSLENSQYFRDMSQHLTPLGLAIYESQLPMVQLLLKYKADPNDTQAGDNSVLFNAIYKPEILEVLLTAGGKVETRDLSYGTALLHQAARNQPLAVQILLKHGANINVRKTGSNGAYENGYTPLHYAALNAASNNIEILLNNHADPNIRGINGRTPLDILKDAARSKNSSADRILAGQLADLLRQHGALDNLPDWDRITISRPAAKFSQPLFYKNSNDCNQVSLYDLIGVQYDLLTSAWAGKTRTVIERYGTFPVTTDLPFPDFTSVIIHHPSPDGLKWETRKIDLAAALNSNDCGSDVRLQFGDVVEIPEANHILNQSWNGLSTNELAALKTCLTRHLQITVNGQATNFVVAPQITFGLLTGATFAERLKNLNQVQLTTFEPFMLWPVLDESKTLLSSSDLAQVKVKRTDAATGKIREWIVDCSDPKSPPNFWLRDGDVIEVPEKR